MPKKKQKGKGKKKKPSVITALSVKEYRARVLDRADTRQRKMYQLSRQLPDMFRPATVCPCPECYPVAPDGYSAKCHTQVLPFPLVEPYQGYKPLKAMTRVARVRGIGELPEEVLTTVQAFFTDYPIMLNICQAIAEAAHCLLPGSKVVFGRMVTPSGLWERDPYDDGVLVNHGEKALFRKEYLQDFNRNAKHTNDSDIIKWRRDGGCEILGWHCWIEWEGIHYDLLRDVVYRDGRYNKKDPYLVKYYEHDRVDFGWRFKEFEQRYNQTRREVAKAVLVQGVFTGPCARVMEKGGNRLNILDYWEQNERGKSGGRKSYTNPRLQKRWIDLIQEEWIRVDNRYIEVLQKAVESRQPV